MDDQQRIPKLLTFYFGEAAQAAERGASRRLPRWSRAFEDWLAERQSHFKPVAQEQALLAWRRLARQCQKMFVGAEGSGFRGYFPV